MAIPETQLNTWSSQGAMSGSRDTYSSVRAVLEDGAAPYAGRRPHIFLQGSYRNDTNVFAESDVDIVVRLDSVYYYDISALSDADQEAYKQRVGVSAYTLREFKAEVTGWLQRTYGGDVQIGNKAVTIAARGNRRKADVLICAKHKRYFYQGLAGTGEVEGIKFLTGDGQWVVNYPIQHSDNLTARHQAVRQWLKPTIRIFKNMRNSMLADGYLQAGTAPSYFLEGMLANVPDAQFGPSSSNTVANCINWLWQTDRGALWCANGQHRLTGDNSATSWPVANCTGFLRSTMAFWNEWV